ncbi:MAG TPA: hypothetical protein VIF83_15145 [Gemmatimonadaceae bacterium]
MRELRLASLFAVAVLAGCVEVSKKERADTATVRTAPAIAVTRVNRGTYGMASQVRWILSPDSTVIVAVVDPAGVENDALPNAFFFGSETRNFQARMDSVWDVAPSPDWQSIAFSRAYIVSVPELDSIPPDAWVTLSRRTGIDTATLRTGSFPTSGMVTAHGVAQPGVIRVPADVRAPGATDAAAPRLFPISRGWRVRWTADGKTIALGNNPGSSNDDATSETWAALDPATGSYHGTLPEKTALLIPKWTKGPRLEMSVPVDVSGAQPINVRAGNRTFSIESSGGVITARETTAGAPEKPPYTIGPGKTLAATRGGRFILALAPRTNLVGTEMPVEAVVYTVGW